ncbi:1,2-phenylacetyl-CoA epoxidase subunit PaaD [Salinisphaera sp. P385]|uniref:1,2-phenylacetyl-CoA epoxidase subunit PaaD n=1 Tax=Spectribacter acetivorans TaxID=3075603 RepID=A0ABU3B5Z4_9GAMM|nr:1,2-phenylacetyl-CoA epoxidase subunit PaaD [Salinisphaera sp. P385]MDT0617872.1 1,2-phenylacetyl-CoA epoxidase subunit PaaD [Salinisphaera sp. P385]
MATTRQQRPTEADIWSRLDAVTDPEIPVISVVDLGIVRAVAWDDDELTVVITPTYSGCPAIRVIEDSIGDAIRDLGVENFRLETRLSPAWTTDWLSERGRERLRDYGIAPPACSAAQVVDISRIMNRRHRAIACPHCGATATEPVSQFGSTPCKALYRCQACLEPFDYFKEH